MSTTTEPKEDTDAMYWCLKCGHRHRRESPIGKWHAGIERPELEERGFRRPTSKPDRATFAAGVALALELRESGQTEVTVDAFEERYEAEEFGEFGDARDALDTLRNDYRDATVRRHSGREWVTFEAGGNDYMKIRKAAREYDTRGMSWGVRH